MICARIESLILEQGMDDALNRAFAFVDAVCFDSFDFRYYLYMSFVGIFYEFAELILGIAVKGTARSGEQDLFEL